MTTQVPILAKRTIKMFRYIQQSDGLQLFKTTFASFQSTRKFISCVRSLVVFILSWCLQLNFADIAFMTVFSSNLPLNCSGIFHEMPEKRHLSFPELKFSLSLTAQWFSVWRKSVYPPWLEQNRIKNKLLNKYVWNKRDNNERNIPSLRRWGEDTNWH